MKKKNEKKKNAARSSLHFKLGKINKLLQEEKQKTQKKRMKKKRK